MDLGLKGHPSFGKGGEMPKSRFADISMLGVIGRPTGQSEE